ncbi:DUF5681 domain-containing protein [Methylibium sp.]|uniref:DUF5681 domain-containing protein n=1 Tax=Methylibium sp. TaxID=2067992 RepID=UPI0025F2084E|nr:DUF5681 domain-containing protein [Methylibium sp.]
MKQGRWKAGQSGNPRGRPAGSGEVAKFRAAIAEQVPALIEKLLARAIEGDVGAARLLLERTVPPIRATEQAAPLELPDGSLTEQGRAVLNAAASGDLSPGQAAQLLAGLAALAKLIETDELAARIAALEGERHGGQSR